MTIIYIDPYENKTSVAIKNVFFGLACIAGIPFLLLLLIISICMVSPSSGSVYASTGREYLLLSTLGLVILIGPMVYSHNRNKKHLDKILSSIKRPSFFNPRESDEISYFSKSAYLGVDTQRGIILYINHVDNHGLKFPTDMLIMGFDANNWKNIELQGNTLKIYTGKPDIPYIGIQHSKAPLLFDKIAAIQGKNFNYEYSIPGYIEHSAKNITEKMGLNLILPRD